jgi:peptidoglycan/xylan/chitin deacetylase (PgdA/CDA1 family)
VRFVSPALKHIVFPALSRSGYLRYRAPADPAILTYHGVFPTGYKFKNPALDGNLVQADSLRRQLQFLKKRYQVISPDDFFQWFEGKLSLPPRSIMLTCDDALRNTLTEMVPILRELGLSCLFFATGASAGESPSLLWYDELYLMLLDADSPVALELPEVGLRVGPIAANCKHSCWWDLVERFSQFDGELRRRLVDQIRGQLNLSQNWREQFFDDAILAARFLTLDIGGLRQLVEAGMSVGAHTLSHPVLARTPQPLAWREISESRGVLEKALGQTVWALAYPFGNAATVTARDYRLAEQAGFRFGFMNFGGGVKAKTNRFALPRIHVTADMGLADFEAHISGFYDSLRRRLLGGAEQEVGGEIDGTGSEQ